MLAVDSEDELDRGDHDPFERPAFDPFAPTISSTEMTVIDEDTAILDAEVVPDEAEFDLARALRSLGT